MLSPSRRIASRVPVGLVQMFSPVETSKIIASKTAVSFVKKTPLFAWSQQRDSNY
jgi:hypothetical protein